MLQEDDVRDVTLVKGASPSIEPETGFAAYLLRSLNDRWKKYLKELRGCRKECTEESVHDLRVAIRRLLSTLDVLRPLFPDDRLTALRKELKDLLGEFSPLRDVQVQMLLLVQFLAAYPSLQPLYTTLVLKERKLTKRLRKHIKKAATSRIPRYMAVARGQLYVVLKDRARVDGKTKALVATAAAAFARAVQLKEMIEPANTETIHDLRLAFKKFRYSTEMLQPIFPWMTKEHFATMNRYQVRMGDIQDIEVFIDTVNAFVLKKRRKADESLLPMHQELARRKTELVAAFLSSADDLHKLWTPTSEIVTITVPHSEFPISR
ncbi:MAG: CHAD domain-containing protein [Bacteroidota bacterium]